MYKIAQHHWLISDEKSEILEKIFEAFPGHISANQTGQPSYSKEIAYDSLVGDAYIQTYFNSDENSIGVEKYYQSEFAQQEYGKSHNIPVNWDNPQETINNVNKIIQQWLGSTKTSMVKLNWYKKAQQDPFEDEEHNMPDITEETDNIDSQKYLDDQAVGRKGYTYTAKLLFELLRSIKEPIETSYVASGSVGWVEYQDIVYEVTVSPAAYGQHFDYFKTLRNRDKSPHDPLAEKIDDELV